MNFLNTVITAGVLSLTSLANVSYAEVVSISDWHNADDDFGGLKQSTYADDLFLAVSKSGVYNKSDSYEMLPGYHWATYEELEERLEEWKDDNGSRDLGEFNYHGLGGWEKYAFDGVQRRDFIFADTAKNERVVYAGISESNTLDHKFSWDANYTNAKKNTVKNWAGFVLIKNKK